MTRGPISSRQQLQGRVGPIVHPGDKQTVSTEIRPIIKTSQLTTRFARICGFFLSLPRAKMSEGRDSGAKSEVFNWLTRKREKSDINLTMKMSMMRGKGIAELPSSLEINKSRILAKDGIVF